MGFFEWLFESDKQKRNKRIFISFAMKDAQYRDHLVTQAKGKLSPFEFLDMSVKKAYPQREWKERCRTKIKRSDGVIVLLSKNSWHSSGLRWEVKCAKDEGKPLLGMHIHKNAKGAVPPELKGKKIVLWSWSNLEDFVNAVNI